MLKASRQTKVVPPPPPKNVKTVAKTLETSSPGSSPVQPIADGFNVCDLPPCSPTPRVHVTRRECNQLAVDADRLRRRLCLRTGSSCAVAELLKTLRRIMDVKFTAQKKRESASCSAKSCSAPGVLSSS